MPYTGIDDLQLNVRKQKPLFDAMAKKGVVKALSFLKFGRLVVEENGHVYSYGQPANETDLVANLSVHAPSVYRDVLFSGTIGAGESYMLGHWTTPDLLKVIRVLVLNMQVVEYLDNNTSLLNKISHFLLHLSNLNTKQGSQKNISAHYDLGNDFFKLILDKSMMYSAAIYPTNDSPLEVAAEYKLERICQKLKLKSSDHLLEIGTGWGGMAIYAAKHYGCKVTTTTISKEQYAHAKQWVESEGLSDKVDLLLEDYRDLKGAYDKIVSIEMIEAVGHKFYESYFSKCSRLLKDDGLMLIQAITIPDQRYHQAKNSIDFIQKYIFPGGCLPSNSVIAKHIADDTNMQIVGLEDITMHYAKTLKEWRKRFFENINAVMSQGFDNRFVRMWEFYMCYCEAGFQERVIGTSQFVFAKPSARLRIE
ncbi:MAG: cyclopropane-fatty-acyl-phospholipid synthase family protein [Cellvibrionaceae bacterium]